MDQLRVTITFARILVTTAARRLVRGRARPTWSLWYETFARFMQAESDVMATLDAPGARDRLLRRSQPTPLRKELTCERTVLGDDDKGAAPVVVEWFSPPTISTDFVLLYLHGGGYVFGSIQSHEDFVARLAIAGEMKALAIEYRLAPEFPFPHGRDDVLTVIDRLAAQGVPTNRIVIAGDSAGGGLALQALYELRASARPMPAAAVLLSPWSDLTCEFESFIKNDVFDYVHAAGILDARSAYAKDHKSEDVSVSFASHEGFPPMLILAGEAEMLRDNASQLAAAAERAGVDVTLEIWPDMIHAWPQFAFVLKEGRAAVERIGNYLRAVATDA